MKASELRLGNLIYNKQGDIVYVNTNHLTLLSYGIEDEFKPIPLTEEWVLKFGFENKLIGCKENQFWFNYLSIFRIHDDGFGFHAVLDSKRIRYVHELQNLYFAIKREELTFKQEKNEQ